MQVAENILMFFQQKFCRSISNPDMDRLKKKKKKTTQKNDMDRLIVDQLGCMAIARTDNEDKVTIFEILPIFLILLHLGSDVLIFIFSGHKGNPYDCTSEPKGE